MQLSSAFVCARSRVRDCPVAEHEPDRVAAGDGCPGGVPAGVDGSLPHAATIRRALIEVDPAGLQEAITASSLAQLAARSTGRKEHRRRRRMSGFAWDMDGRIGRHSHAPAAHLDLLGPAVGATEQHLYVIAVDRHADGAAPPSEAESYAVPVAG